MSSTLSGVSIEDIDKAIEMCLNSGISETEITAIIALTDAYCSVVEQVGRLETLERVVKALT